jgi:L-aspartate oxidase
VEFDYLVLGSGIAGLTFALHAAPHGSVGIITKKQRSESNTNYAQGGIAAVVGEDDSWELHLQDTLTAGAGLCDRTAVKVLVQNGYRMVQWLLDLGAQFDRAPSPSGEISLALGREGGHSRNRIIHSADHTGWEIERTLLRAIRNTPHIQTMEHYFALDLILQEGRCVGVRVLDTATLDILEIRAKAVLLATGGCGQVYQHTTNPPIATGDGIGIAWRAGAAIANMEFIQFHPTTLYHPQGHSFLISEAVRGEGAILKRQDGYRFMPDYDPRADLAPRDIVARAIDAELKKTGDSCVYLDVTHLPEEHSRKRFPTIYERCLQYGIDMTREPIPVVPAAHYMCGGVWTDMKGRTTVRGLYACGEVTCTGVHGANRLASNSLLEALVFAERAALHAVLNLHEPAPPPPTIPFDLERPDDKMPDDLQALNRINAFQQHTRRSMWQYVGIVRSMERLHVALNTLHALAMRVEPLLQQSIHQVESWELRNLLTAAMLITQSALLRHESRGLHYLIDYPNTDENPRLWTVLQRDEKSGLYPTTL